MKPGNSVEDKTPTTEITTRAHRPRRPMGGKRRTTGEDDYMEEPTQKKRSRRPEHRDRGWRLPTEANQNAVRGAQVTSHPAPGETHPISGNRPWQNSHGVVE